MRSTLPLLLTAALLLPAYSAQEETPTAQARIAIQTNYHAIDAAFARKDLDAAYTYFAADYVGVDKDGKRTGKAAARDYNAKLLQKVKTLQAETQVTACALSPKGAEVQTRQTSFVTAEARILFVRKTVHVQSESHTRDFWVQTPQGWRMTESRILSEASIVDGKPGHDVPKAR